MRKNGVKDAQGAPLMTSATITSRGWIAMSDGPLVSTEAEVSDLVARLRLHAAVDLIIGPRAESLQAWRRDMAGCSIHQRFVFSLIWRSCVCLIPTQPHPFFDIQKTLHL